MIPIPGLESVRCAWVTIQAEGFDLHGFLIYATSDHYFPEYVTGEGLADLDRWSTNDCAIFVVHSPSEQWIEYTKAKKHIWWKLFGDTVENSGLRLDTLSMHGNSALLQIGEERKTMQEVFAPCFNTFMHGEEIEQILRCFDLRETQHPCLILFKDLFKYGPVWYIDMSDLVGKPESDLRRELRSWFDTGEFRHILEEARNA